MKKLQIGKVRRWMLLLLMLPLMTDEAWASYDFSVQCSSGQTLYYTITDASHHYVKLCCPGIEAANKCWDGYTKPTGNISISSSVSYNNSVYTITSIGHFAFYECYGLTAALWTVLQALWGCSCALSGGSVSC